MSKTSKIILWIVIIIVVVLVAWLFFKGASPAVAPSNAPLTETQSGQYGAASQAAVALSVPVSGLTTSASDTSNAALNSDISNLSNQSSALDQDSVAANQPVQ